MSEEIPTELVFLDESGANLALARLYARAIGGQRIKCPIPTIRGTKFSIISAVTCDNVLAAMYGEWATDTEIFTHFITEELCPKLIPSHTVLMDNINFHKSPTVKEAIQETGAKLIYLPPYSPDFNPIENMWSKIKTILREFSARTLEAFQRAISIAFKAISSQNLAAWYVHCGYTVP